MTYKPRVYTASKINYLKLWRMLRGDPDWDFVEFTASWVNHPDIDAEVEGTLTTPEVFREAWMQNVKDVKESDFVLLYGSDRDAVRGSLIECGIAIGAGGIPVLTVGFSPDPHSWLYIPGVKTFASLREARDYLYRFTTMIPSRNRSKKDAQDS